jgi:hypothetical protein
VSDSRSTARLALGTLLSSALTGAQAVYAYPRATFDGQSPVVSIGSMGTRREAYTYNDTLPTFRYNIHVFVLYQDATAGWGEDDAETALDTMEAAIDAVLIANQETANWQNIQYAGQTTVSNIILGGLTYRHETIPVEIEVHH